MSRTLDPSTIEPWLGRTWVCECGMLHSIPIEEVYIETGAIERIAPFCSQRSISEVLIVADSRTYEAAGRDVHNALHLAGLKSTVCLLAESDQGDVVADEASVVRVMVDLEPRTQAVLAVGAGTIHDVVRFVCHRTHRIFISIPTAASVDGYASVGAPLLLGGFKQTIPACAPTAIFADLDVLAAAPPEMTAAGVGDMLGKFTSLADWALGASLFGEAHCSVSAEMTRRGLERCIEHLESIAERTPEGVGQLMQGLTLSGLAMLMVGHSRPASGAEHHLSHFWEMKYIEQGRRALLHGAKVGAATVMMAGTYARLARMTSAEAVSAISAGHSPDAEEDRETIRRAYGAIADQVIRENGLDGEAENTAAQTLAVEQLKRSWDAVRHIASGVPSPGQLASWLAQVGGPSAPEALGLDPGLVEQSLSSAMFVRNRYTVMRLARRLAQPKI